MRVLIPLEHLDAVGGAQRSVLELSEALSARGFEFVVLYRVAGSFTKRWAAISPFLVQAPLWTSPRRPLRALVGTIQSARKLPTDQIDAVFCNLFANLPLSILVARRRRIPILMWIREPAVGGPRRLVYRWLLRSVDRVIFISEAQRRDFEQAGLIPTGAEVIHNGVDTHVYRPPDHEERERARSGLDLNDHDRVVLYLGRLDPTKGIEVLFKAIGRLSEPRPVVLVAGGGSEWRRDPGGYASRLTRTAPAAVRFVSRIDDPLPLLWAADIVVIPSLWEEPLPRSQLEAMACGIPVVASRTGGIPEALPGELAALLVPPGEPAALAAGITRTLDAATRGRLSGLVRANAVDRFDLNRVADRLAEVMHTLSPGQ